MLFAIPFTLDGLRATLSQVIIMCMRTNIDGTSIAQKKGDRASTHTHTHTHMAQNILNII